MPEQPSAQFDIDPVCGVREKIGSEDSKYGLEYRDRHQTDDQHIERAERTDALAPCR